MKIFACFPSKYLKAADLQDKHITAVMSHVALEEVRDVDEAKMLPVLYFKAVPKGMVLNKTNAKTISSAYGEETDHWSDMPIILFAASVAFGADTVEAIRLKLPPANARATAIANSPNSGPLGERMNEQWAQHHADNILSAMRRPSEPLTEADYVRALEAFRAKGRKKTQPLDEAIAIHDANGVIWDETMERPLTEEENAEIMRESLRRSNAAMDDRKAAPKDDGLDIPQDLRRPRVVPIQQSIDYRWSKGAQ